MTGRQLWQPLAALLFPERCPLCDEICVGGGVCGACREEAVHSPSLRSLGDGGLLCLAPYGYEGKLRDAILRFKFEGRRDYVPFFAEQIAREIRAQQHFDCLELQVNAQNLPARAFYEATGFTERSINLELLE